jgi:hypothetical protein
MVRQNSWQKKGGGIGIFEECSDNQINTKAWHKKFTISTSKVLDNRDTHAG